MYAKLRHAQRGQAVIETVIFLPMFLLGLFGMIWAVQAAVQYERVESAVRYSGLISQYTNPYTDYSLYSLYGQLGSATVPTISCGTILTTPLNDGAPTFTLPSAPFFSPSPSTPSAGSCLSNSLIGWPAGTGLNQDVMLSQVQPSVTANVAVPSQLQNTLTAFTSTSASHHFFRPIGINTILACYPSLNQQVQKSLQYATDTSFPTLPIAMNGVVAGLSPGATSNCTTH